MKKIALLTTVCFLLLCPIAKAQDTSPNANQVQIDNNTILGNQKNQDSQNPHATPEDIWNEEIDTVIYNNYGSYQSPAFLNQPNPSPGDADYVYSEE